MIAQLVTALSKSRKNPGYLRYFLRNADFIRHHIPALYRFLHRGRRFDLGPPGSLRRLHIVLRTTDAVMNINASRRLEEAGIATRNDVIRVGGCSLFPAAARFAKEFGSDNMRITLVADRLSEAGLAQYREAAGLSGVDFDVRESDGHGNGPTFQKQIDIALQNSDDTLAFVLEDDYMLDERTLSVCFRVMRDHSGVIGMNPHFHPDRVRFQDIGKLVAIDGRLYCRVPSTCCTFFMPVGEMRRFEKKLRLYDGWEKGSIGCAWEKGVCLAPVGWTMAEHLHRSDLSPVQALIERER